MNFLSRVAMLTGTSATASGNNTLEIAFGIALLVMAVFLIIAVLLQSGKDKSLSGSIAGGADTFFSKSKSKTRDKILSRLTLVVSVIFTLLVVVVYIYVSSKY